MTSFLPPNLLSLFFPRDPLPFKPTPSKKKCPPNKKLTGVSVLLDIFEEHKEEPPVIYESRYERQQRKVLVFSLQLKEKEEIQTKYLADKKQKWDPKTDENIQSDPYKTLFVSRLSYETTESKLRKEFEVFGSIRQIRMVYEKISGKFRGYAFIEYEHTRDMHAAYKNMDGKKIDGRRILVDAERGRVEKNWLPMYLGGGLGGPKRIAKSKTDRQERNFGSFADYHYKEDRPRKDYDRNERRNDYGRGRYDDRQRGKRYDREYHHDNPRRNRFEDKQNSFPN